MNFVLVMSPHLNNRPKCWLAMAKCGCRTKGWCSNVFFFLSFSFSLFLSHSHSFFSLVVSANLCCLFYCVVLGFTQIIQTEPYSHKMSQSQKSQTPSLVQCLSFFLIFDFFFSHPSFFHLKKQTKNSFLIWFLNSFIFNSSLIVVFSPLPHISILHI